MSRLASYPKPLISLGVFAVLLTTGFLLPWYVYWTVLVLVVIWLSRAIRRNRRDRLAMTEGQPQRLSAQGKKALIAEIRRQGDVNVDDAGVTRTLRNGRVSNIPWEDVQSVSVIVLPRRHHQADVLVSLKGSEGSGFGVVMPYHEAPLDFLVRLGALPDLEVDRVADVLTKKPLGTTVCWQRRSRRHKD
jgi:hypothetical protein